MEIDNDRQCGAALWGIDEGWEIAGGRFQCVGGALDAGHQRLRVGGLALVVQELLDRIGNGRLLPGFGRRQLLDGLGFERIVGLGQVMHVVVGTDGADDVGEGVDDRVGLAVLCHVGVSVD